jgi:hypothetical protein
MKVGPYFMSEWRAGLAAVGLMLIALFGLICEVGGGSEVVWPVPVVLCSLSGAVILIKLFVPADSDRRAR